MNTNTKRTIAYFSAFFILGTVIASLGPTLTGLAHQVGVNVSALSVLFSARSLGYLCGSLLTGVLLDRMRGHPLLAGVLITALILLGVVPQITSLPLMGLVLFMVGWMLGSLDVGSNTLLAQTQREKSGPYLNAMYLSAGVGSFLIPLYFGYVAMDTGYQTMAFLMAPLALWMILTPSPPKPTRDDGGHPLTHKFDILILFAVLTLLFVGLEVGYSGWIFTYLQKTTPGPDQTAYTITSLFWMAITVGRLLAIPTAVYIQPVRAVFAYLSGGLISTGIMILFKEQGWSVWLGTAGMGLSLAALFPTTFNYIQRSIAFSGRHNGVVWSVGSMGGILLPLFIGWGIGALCVFSMMFIVLSAWTLAMFIFLFLIQRNHDLSRLFRKEK
ncbi:MAG: MFS transporter [Anaerolineales bacterium]